MSSVASVGCSELIGSGSFSSLVMPISLPPASWIFLAAVSDHVFILISAGLVSVPFESSL